MNILFFDTETTGLPINYNAPVSDVDNWPRMVQIAWIETKLRGVSNVKTFDTLIKPEGFEIPAEAAAIHGFTTEQAINEGIPVKDALSMFSIALSGADLIVGHNISFDRKIVGAEMIRAGREDSLHGKPRICTMITGTNFCQLEGKRGYKWPKLEELYLKLFNEPLQGGHNAKADIFATAKCFFAMVQRGIITQQMIDRALNPVKVEGF